ncbi:uncharacterized protein K452DRAFT_309804 [Aplosporella prunicola CBS 121167]|uniref:Zn(2)-C6 fungal-type domain-containing protein n=1 Tax=Aplosporella prunicola CBS 121167 TaxID=1176127 RepID=A0A6A6B927_9PEZI|nr:uncharacterized protein K452DRAFT_309804 [Aplosporella prunicola CBS 121167]KAF2140689.1 hypothetical protein K452DRAFT_309804 [Aplosporella prunicola CBS 121167]
MPASLCSCRCHSHILLSDLTSHSPLPSPPKAAAPQKHPKHITSALPPTLAHNDPAEPDPIGVPQTTNRRLTELLQRQHPDPITRRTLLNSAESEARSSLTWASALGSPQPSNANDYHPQPIHGINILGDADETPRTHPTDACRGLGTCRPLTASPPRPLSPPCDVGRFAPPYFSTNKHKLASALGDPKQSLHTRCIDWVHLSRHADTTNYPVQAPQQPTTENRFGANTTAMGSTYQSTTVAEGAPTANLWLQSHSPNNAKPKHVSFELLLQDTPQHRARLPMRVNIWPHDTTESIVATVKNFHGIYDGQGYGVSFEDRDGNTLIARYENFEHNMVVYVRRIPQEPTGTSEYSHTPRHSMSPRKSHYDDRMLPPQQLSRPSSRGARNRSASPRGRRSVSVSTNSKSRSRPSFKGRATSSHGSLGDMTGDYSDSDGEGSVTSSRRDNLASAEISLDNIVEGGRRKRAKFDSSELPLFAPPQVPMTNPVPSVSPHRRINSNNGVSPFTYSNQQTFSYTHPLPSPQSHGQVDISYMQGMPMGTPYAVSSGHPHGHRLRTRGSGPGQPSRQSYGYSGAFPTPDPTVGGSVISDEDVALQLMRLGDASNFSSVGRTSTSTLDDALSGKAEVASSDEASEDCSEDDLPHYHGPLQPAGRLPDHELPRSYDSGEDSGDDYEDNRDDSFKDESDELMPDENGIVTSKVPKVKHRAESTISKTFKVSKPRAHNNPKSKTKTVNTAKPPISPTSLPSISRKTSSASLTMQQFGADEEDLSTKPRCQRCRKSKKGCDRQRPCQRCKDAGIGIEGCVSEDEGNGRKGRYGRHMGVPVKKTVPEVPAFPDGPTAVLGGVVGYSSFAAAADKSKKRKR